MRIQYVRFIVKGTMRKQSTSRLRRQRTTVIIRQTVQRIITNFDFRMAYSVALHKDTLLKGEAQAHALSQSPPYSIRRAFETSTFFLCRKKNSVAVLGSSE